MSSITVNRIKHVTLFNGCTRRTLELIDGLCTTVALQVGRTLCSRGEPGSEFFVLLDGVVEVRTHARTVARIHDGGWFGETALIHNVVHQASVTTETASTVTVFNRREFTSLCAAAPSVRARLEHTAALYLREEEPLAEEWYEPTTRRATTNVSRTTTRQPTSTSPNPKHVTGRARTTIETVP